MNLRINVNGVPRDVASDPEQPLLWFLRDELGLTGTKFGCGMAQCGACTIHLDGTPQRACSLPVKMLAGRSVTTIEAVADRVAEAVKAAWVKHNVPQCGYCQSGQIMSAIALLRADPAPSAGAITTAMSGNICRCGTYPRIRAAITDAASTLANARPDA